MKQNFTLNSLLNILNKAWREWKRQECELKYLAGNKKHNILAKKMLISFAKYQGGLNEGVHANLGNILCLFK